MGRPESSLNKVLTFVWPRLPRWRMWRKIERIWGRKRWVEDFNDLSLQRTYGQQRLYGTKPRSTPGDDDLRRMCPNPGTQVPVNSSPARPMAQRRQLHRPAQQVARETDYDAACGQFRPLELPVEVPP